MVKDFEFATATRIVFGNGRAMELPVLIKEFGSRLLVVTGKNPGRIQPLLDLLQANNFTMTLFSVGGEPTIGLAKSGAELGRSSDCQCVVAIGGGSVIDCGKAIAALAANPGPPLDYLEVIGKAQPLQFAPLPFVAVPTTAGTGAEVTRNAVLHSPEHRVKVSLRSALMLPRVALVDPDLTRELPPALTASTGLDALTQLIEPFVSNRSNPVSDAVCREAIPRVIRSLRKAFENGGDADARNEMALGSLCGGLALANAGLGAVHGLAGPIGGMFEVAHGAICAALLPEVMEKNVTLAQEKKDMVLVRRYNDVARLLTGVPTARAPDGVQWVRNLCLALHIPCLALLGIRRADLPEIAEKAEASSSLKGNPIELTRAQLIEILERAF
jgi:alcohol dehydrogenase class IV